MRRALLLVAAIALFAACDPAPHDDPTPPTDFSRETTPTGVRFTAQDLWARGNHQELSAVMEVAASFIADVNASDFDLAALDADGTCERWQNFAFSVLASSVATDPDVDEIFVAAFQNFSSAAVTCQIPEPETFNVYFAKAIGEWTYLQKHYPQLFE